MERDFTYIDDIIDGIVKLIDKTPVRDEKKEETSAPYVVHNIGNNSPVKLEEFISTIEDKLGKKAEKIYMDMQPGDVLRTYADVSALEEAIGFKPRTSLWMVLENLLIGIKNIIKYRDI